MKTPDEIKKGLEPCGDKSDCEWCEFAQQCDIEADALALIQQLEEKYKRAMENAKILSDAVTKLERERDALLHYLTNTTIAPCDICKHEPSSHDINDCKHIREVGIPCFEWRGLCEANGGIHDL